MYSSTVGCGSSVVKTSEAGAVRLSTGLAESSGLAPPTVPTRVCGEMRIRWGVVEVRASGGWPAILPLGATSARSNELALVRIIV